MTASEDQVSLKFEFHCQFMYFTLASLHFHFILTPPLHRWKWSFKTALVLLTCLHIRDTRCLVL